MGVRVKERPKGSGIWWMFISHHGKRKAKKIGKDKRLALAVAKKIEARLVLGELTLKKGQTRYPTFKEYAEKWLAFIKAKRRASTYERYAGILKKHVLPVFKTKPLESISRGDIRDFLVSKSDKYDVRLFRDVISGILNFAVDDEIITSNPAIGITKTLELKNDKETKVTPLNETDLVLFLESAKAHTPEYYPFFLMAVRTGMRLGELLALRWGDVDFTHKVAFENAIEEERPFIWVGHAYRRGTFNPTKTGKSRTVDMSKQLRDVLRDHFTKQKRKALKEGLDHIPELVFHANGKVIEQNSIRRVFKTVLRKAGLREIRFHDLRHTFASLLLSKGESPVYVKEQLGHHSIQMTVDIYGKWIQTKREVGVNRLDTQQCATYAQPAKSKNG